MASGRPLDKLTSTNFQFGSDLLLLQIDLARVDEMFSPEIVQDNGTRIRLRNMFREDQAESLHEALVASERPRRAKSSVTVLLPFLLAPPGHLDALK